MGQDGNARGYFMAPASHLPAFFRTGGSEACFGRLRYPRILSQNPTSLMTRLGPLGYQSLRPVLLSKGYHPSLLRRRKIHLMQYAQQLSLSISGFNMGKGNGLLAQLSYQELGSS